MIRSLEDLNREASDIQLQIRKLLLNNNSFNEGIADKLIVIATITSLRSKLMIIQREIRERSAE